MLQNTRIEVSDLRGLTVAELYALRRELATERKAATLEDRYAIDVECGRINRELDSRLD